MNFVWLTPLIVFVTFTGIILLQEYIRERSHAQQEREMFKMAKRIKISRTSEIAGGREEVYE